jgi:hypothetical protein
MQLSTNDKMMLAKMIVKGHEKLGCYDSGWSTENIENISS